MRNRGNFHLWIIGVLSFAGFACAQPNNARETVDVAPIEQRAQMNAPAINMIEAEQLYVRRCGACHSLDANRVGPLHRGVVGRQAGSLTDYNYSEALERATFVWDAKRLDQWLSNPESLVPGQMMGFRLSDEAERNAIIRYLEAQSR
ncbi:MAG: c-type cytochrome [Pseudomonadota bacterium]